MTDLSVPSPEDEPVLTVPRAGRLVGLGESAAYDAVRRGDLPSIRFGRRVLVPTAALRRLLGIDNEAAPPADDDTPERVA